MTEGCTSGQCHPQGGVKLQCLAPRGHPRGDDTAEWNPQISESCLLAQDLAFLLLTTNFKYGLALIRDRRGCVTGHEIFLLTF